MSPDDHFIWQKDSMGNVMNLYVETVVGITTQYIVAGSVRESI